MQPAFSLASFHRIINMLLLHWSSSPPPIPSSFLRSILGSSPLPSSHRPLSPLLLFSQFSPRFFIPSDTFFPPQIAPNRHFLFLLPLFFPLIHSILRSFHFPLQSSLIPQH